MSKSATEFDIPMYCMDCTCYDVEEDYCNLAKKRFWFI